MATAKGEEIGAEEAQHQKALAFVIVIVVDI